jgi:hypothetical protein
MKIAFPNKVALGLFLMSMCMATTTRAMGQDHGAAKNTRDSLVGAWRLAWLEEPGADGRLQRVDCTGLLVFTSDGHISVQVMYKNVKAKSNAPMQYAQGGYEASFGTYVIEDAHGFTYHVEGALVRTLIGKDLKRAYERSGNQLIVRSVNADEHWRVTWERD